MKDNVGKPIRMKQNLQIVLGSVLSFPINELRHLSIYLYRFNYYCMYQAFFFGGGEPPISSQITTQKLIIINAWPTLDTFMASSFKLNESFSLYPPFASGLITCFTSVYLTALLLCVWQTDICLASCSGHVLTLSCCLSF